jgi:hypothetical protein
MNIDAFLVCRLRQKHVTLFCWFFVSFVSTVYSSIVTWYKKIVHVRTYQIYSVLVSSWLFLFFLFSKTSNNRKDTDYIYFIKIQNTFNIMKKNVSKQTNKFVHWVKQVFQDKIWVFKWKNIYNKRALPWRLDKQHSNSTMDLFSLKILICQFW